MNPPLQIFFTAAASLLSKVLTSNLVVPMPISRLATGRQQAGLSFRSVKLEEAQGRQAARSPVPPAHAASVVFFSWRSQSRHAPEAATQPHTKHRRREKLGTVRLMGFQVFRGLRL